MYKIISQGQNIHSTDEPYYITLKSPNGKPQPTDEEHADCVSVLGKLYQLPNAKHIDPDLPEVTIKKGDGALEAYNVGQQAQETSEALAVATADMESAICDLDMMYSECIAELEMTICDMDMMLNAQEEA